jgi:hypothetical protein
MTFVDSHRNGFALPAALLALILVGALVTGGLYAAMAEDETSANTEFSHVAFLAAEQGLDNLLGTKNRIYFEDSVGVPGVADTLGPVSVNIDGVQAQYTVYVQRLNTRVFKVDSEGVVRGGGRYAGARRRLAQVMRITFTSVPMDRAVSTQEGIRMRGLSGISGTDTVPSTWTDCPAVGTQTAVVAVDSNTIDIKGAAGITGSPALDEDATMDSASFSEYGDMVLDDLIAVAEKTYPANATINGMAPSLNVLGTCNKGDPSNWGDPLNPVGECHTYWPIIHSPGDLHVSNGVGQGILIVEGDLDLTGNFEFYGLVFVYGSLTTAGTGNKILGSTNILGSGAGSELDSQGLGNTRLQLSACSIDRAHRYNERFSRAFPLTERKFVDLSGLGLH